MSLKEWPRAAAWRLRLAARVSAGDDGYLSTFADLSTFGGFKSIFSRSCCWSMIFHAHAGSLIPPPWLNARALAPATQIAVRSGDDNRNDSATGRTTRRKASQPLRTASTCRVLPLRHSQCRRQVVPVLKFLACWYCGARRAGKSSAAAPRSRHVKCSAMPPGPSRWERKDGKKRKTRKQKKRASVRDAARGP